jgi:phenylpropionate dioxygenase-like ring-hydroxylating dioxygenase large terminal subunit
MFLTNTSPGLGRAWYAVATTDEVGDAPHAVQLLGRRWMLVRLDGALHAMEDRCPHRLAPLSIGKVCGSRVQCRYHGWEFTGDGTCVRTPSVGEDVPIPSRADVATPFAVTERYGLVWLAPEPPECDIPEFAEWDDATYDACRNEPRRTTTSAFQLTDNFLDATHIPTVHLDTFGVPDAEYLPPHDVVVDGVRASTTYHISYRNADDPLVATGEHPLVQPQVLYKEFAAVSNAVIRLDHPLTDKRIAILFALQPEHDGSTRIYKQMARNDFAGDTDKLAASIVFEDLVMDEDLEVLEAYHEMGVHLDLRREVHTRTDKLSVAYRRMLAAFVSGASTVPAPPDEPSEPSVPSVSPAVAGAPLG